MIVILEGNDRAGKTTIAETLVQEDNFRRVHFGPPATNDFGQEFLLALTGELLTEIAAEHPANLVFDRAHLGELVYGPIDRGETRMTWDQMARIERIFQTAGTILVWVDTDPVVCWSRAVGTNDEALLQRFENIHDAYGRAFKESSLSKIRLTNVEDIRTVARWLQ